MDVVRGRTDERPRSRRREGPARQRHLHGEEPARVDRGGVVGPDGATHAGNLDLSYLRCVPNMVVMAPADENECRQMLSTGHRYDGPAAVRYPRGTGPGVAIQPSLDTLPIGKAELRQLVAVGVGRQAEAARRRQTGLRQYGEIGRLRPDPFWIGRGGVGKREDEGHVAHKFTGVLFYSLSP